MLGVGAFRSRRQECAHLAAVMRAEGRSWAEIAEDFRRRFRINARKALRWARGWSQDQVAQEWSRRWPDDLKNAQAISMWESWPEKGREPSVLVLERLAQIYQCHVGDLLADFADHGLQDTTAKAAADRPRSARSDGDTDHLGREASLFDPMDLAGMATASEIGGGTVEVVQEAVDLLCRAYPATPAPLLRDRSRERLRWMIGLLGKRLSLDQHRELLVGAGWLAALLGCVHYDLGEREQAEAARLAAQQFGSEVGHGELLGWAHEMSAWFALVEGRYEHAIESANAGLAVAGSTSAGVQLALQEAKGHARLGDRRRATEALDRGAVVLGRLPRPIHSEHHFVFDHTKWSLYAAGIYALVEDDNSAEEHAREVLAKHVRPDGSSNAPMRVADARIDLAIVHVHRGDLDAAIEEGLKALDYERRSLADLLKRVDDLDLAIRVRYADDPRANELHERLRGARAQLGRG